jgi:hypothetical protein
MFVLAPTSDLYRSPRWSTPDYPMHHVNPRDRYLNAVAQARSAEAKYLRAEAARQQAVAAREAAILGVEAARQQAVAARGVALLDALDSQEDYLDPFDDPFTSSYGDHFPLDPYLDLNPTYSQDFVSRVRLHDLRSRALRLRQFEEERRVAINRQAEERARRLSQLISRSRPAHDIVLRSPPSKEEDGIDLIFIPGSLPEKRQCGLKVSCACAPIFQHPSDHTTDTSIV